MLIFLRARPPAPCRPVACDGATEVGTHRPIVKMVRRIAFTGWDEVLLSRRGLSGVVLQKRPRLVPNGFVVTGGTAALEPKIISALANLRIGKRIGGEEG